jgi:hypothetical protein
MTASWKTSLTGVLTLLGTLIAQTVLVLEGKESWSTALATGIPLLFAGVQGLLSKDAGVSNAPVPGPAVAAPK